MILIAFNYVKMLKTQKNHNNNSINNLILKLTQINHIMIDTVLRNLHDYKH